MRFLKIKVKDRKIRMEYEVPNGDVYDEFSFASSDTPKDTFHPALQALALDVVDMCELPADYVNRIFVTGVSFSYGGEKEVMGATIIAQMHLKNSNVRLNLNTPHKIKDFYCESGDDAQLLSDDCIKRLDTLIAESRDFTKGVRAQGNLFAEAAA